MQHSVTHCNALHDHCNTLLIVHNKLKCAYENYQISGTGILLGVVVCYSMFWSVCSVFSVVAVCDTKTSQPT